ncbi:MAG: hypothetical protein ABR880_02240 [Candidatus Sulfotelmatobacter sp.]|jgi:hypothetical protein
MMEQHDRSKALFYYFHLEDQVPETHLLRLIDRHISFAFVREKLKARYGDTGTHAEPAKSITQAQPGAQPAVASNQTVFKYSAGPHTLVVPSGGGILVLACTAAAAGQHQDPSLRSR